MKSLFPTRTKAQRLGEQGSALVSRIVGDDFSWIFKRNPQEFDFGIDAHVDIVTDSGKVTGQSFAVQIKFGNSFIKEKNQWGYIFRGESKHFNYLANYPIPVIICICDPATKTCYWEKFDKLQTTATGDGWKMTVPFSNQLHQSKKALLAFLPPVEDAAKELKNMWAHNKMAIEAGIIHYVLDKTDVMAKEIALPRAYFNHLRLTKELAASCRNKIEISINGYDDDSRELYAIPEVRDYIALLDAEIPELFFFTRYTQPTFTLRLFALCQMEAEPVEKKSPGKVYVKITNPKAIKSFIDRHFPPMNELAEWIELPEESIKEMSYGIVDALRPPTDAQS